MGENGEKAPARVGNWKSIIESKDNTHSVSVVRSKGAVIGFVAYGVIEGQRRIGAIYVLPEAQGGGIGGALLEEAIAWHGRDDDIYLRVAAYNQNAIKFYERNGFEKTNTEIKDHGTPPIPEIEMVLKAA